MRVKFGFELLYGAVGYIFHIAYVDNPSVVYQSDSVAGGFQFFETVAAHQNRFALFMLFLYNIEEGCAHKRVEPRGRLVENYYRRVVHKRGDQSGFLFHALAHAL